MNNSIKRITAIVFGALTVASASAEIKADSLLSVDQNRTEIVEGLVSKWKDHLASGTEKDLKQTLMSLRADKLLALSLAQDQKQFAALLEKDSFLPLKHESQAETGGQGGAVHAKALGEPNTDVVYTPVTPCRLFYTEIASGGAGGALLPGVTRTFDTRGTLTGQGGSAGCSVPATATAIVLQMGAFSSFGLGWINAGPQGSPIPSGVLLAYNNVAFINATSVTLKINPANGQFSTYSNNNRTELYGDVLGYFAPPSNGNGLRVVQTGINTDAPNIINGSANNSASGQGATVAGGGFAGTCVDIPTGGSRPCGNRALADFSTVSGGEANTASGVEATVAGGGRNTASATRSTVGGGVNNTAKADFSTIAGGFSNTASGSFSSTVAGGESNTASATRSTVGGGVDNTASGNASTVGGGERNTASGLRSTIAGGYLNTVSGQEDSTVMGGRENTASGFVSTVAGGYGNTASGTYSFAAGYRANADQDNCFVFGGWPLGSTSCLGVGYVARFALTHGMSIEYFARRPDGGGQRWVHFGDLVPSQTIATWNGAFLSDGGVWTNTSDRNLKENFSRIDPKQMLAKVMALPVTAWNYKAESAGTRHIGPMAQDFKRLFGVGNDDKSIGTVDASGVALAAIQGLNQVVKEKDVKINAQANELASLKRKLEAIEKKLGL